MNTRRFYSVSAAFLIVATFADSLALGVENQRPDQFLVKKRYCEFDANQPTLVEFLISQGFASRAGLQVDMFNTVESPPRGWSGFSR